VKPQITEDILELLDAFTTSAALGTALETGLFWLLAERPLDAPGVAQALNIPPSRCHCWLQVLASVGLLEWETKGYSPSTTARQAILDAYSQETWAFLARAARERFPAVGNLAAHIHEPESVWNAHGLTPPDYFEQLRSDPDRARAFTRMLCEIHAPLAEELAEFIDLTDVHRILDLGGGSGVMAMALLRRHPILEAVVADIPNVCAAGREIASENDMADRIQYLALDFVQEPIPAGFDLVLECDAGRYDESLFREIHGCLNPGGRLIVVDQFAVDPQTPHPTRLHWAFSSALDSTASPRSTADDIRGRLERAGFHVRNPATLPAGDPVRWVRGWTLIEAAA